MYTNVADDGHQLTTVYHRNYKGGPVSKYSIDDTLWFQFGCDEWTITNTIPWGFIEDQVN